MSYAFPFQVNNSTRYENGMTLRDYFAAHATEADVQRFKRVHDAYYTTAQAKYKYADAMLKERLKDNANTSNS